MKALKPITIIGGGLAGLTLGIGLRQRKIPTTVIEAGRYPRHRVCGEFISGMGREVLGRFEIEDTLRKAGAIESHSDLFRSQTAAGPIRPLPTRALSISRFVLDAELARRFQDLDGQLEENQRWREADFGDGVVRATGRRLDSGKAKSPWLGLKMHARNVSLAADLEMHLIRGGYVGLCRLPNDEVNVCGLFHHHPAKSVGAGDVRSLLLGPSNSVLRQRLAGADFDENSFCSVAGISLDPVAARPGECCVGDALTMIPPVTGNGMSMAFESAALALDPLAAYSEGSLSWPDVRQKIAGRYRLAFSSRLRWAKWLHAFLFSNLFKLLGPAALRSELVWRTTFRHTR